MDYILRYTNPKSDAEKKIVAKVTVNLDFTENKSSGNPPVDGKKYNGIGNGILEGLPTPYTNLVTNQEVPSTGTIGPVTEFSFLEIYGTSSNLVDNNGNLNEIGLNKMYMTFLDSVKRKLYQEYKKVYGLELYQTLSYETGLTTLEPVVEKIEGSSVPNQTDASLGQTASGVTASGTTASTQPPTKEDPAPVTASQSTTKLVGDYIFDITKEGYFVNKELGELKIVSKEEAIRAEEEFDFGAEDLTVSEEYIEENFVGEEELFNQVTVNENLQNFDLSSSPDKTEELPTDDALINYNDPKYVGGEWKKYDIDKVLKEIGKTSHKPSSKFQASLKKILLWMKQDKDITDPREAAYLLGTAYAESGYSLQRWEADYACTGAGIPYGKNGPCSSATSYYRSTKGGKRNYYDLGVDSKGQCFFGRGLIQLTGKANYEKYGKKIGVDLISNGDLALKEDNSYKIALIYLVGRTFSHVKKGDLTKARKSVNGGTKGIDEVNGAYKDWLNIFNKLA